MIIIIIFLCISNSDLNLNTCFKCNIQVLPKLKINIGTTYGDKTFLDEPRVTAYVQECLKLSWLMVIQDPPMTMEMNPVSVTYENFRAYKTRGKFLNYVVWPVLLLNKGGPLVMKGVAEFTNTATCNETIKKRCFPV